MTNFRDVNIYKPNKKQTGSAIQFKMGRDRTCMFLECAKQHDSMDSKKPYDWENKIIVKLGISDISKLFMYLKLSKPSKPISIYHESPGGGNKTIELKYQEFQGRPGYFLSVGYKKPESSGSQVYKVSGPISMDEAEILKVAFPLAIEVILGWRNSKGV